MPSPLHYLPLHHRDWMASSTIQMMSVTAEGIFFRLILVQWEDGQLNPSPTKLMRLARATAEEWAQFEEWLDECFPLGEDGNRRNPRCAAEREAASATVERNKLNGARGGRPPKEKPKGNPLESEEEPNKNPSVNSGLCDEKPKQNPDESQSESESESESEDLDKQSSAGAIQNSDGVIGANPRPPMTVDVQGHMMLLGVSQDRSAEEAEKYASDRKRKGWKIGNTPIADWREDVKMWVGRMPEFARGGGTSPPGVQRGRESGIDQAARILAEEGLLV